MASKIASCTKDLEAMATPASNAALHLSLLSRTKDLAPLLSSPMAPPYVVSSDPCSVGRAHMSRDGRTRLAGICGEGDHDLDGVKVTWWSTSLRYCITPG
jgi:hypothetical protein